MTHSELQRINALTEENRKLKQENERLRSRRARLIYERNQILNTLLPSPMSVFVAEDAE